MPTNAELLQTEFGLYGEVQGTISPSDTTIYARMYDISGEAREPDSETKLFVINAGTKRAEIIRCSSHSTSAGVTTFTGCERFLVFTDDALTAGTAQNIFHYDGDKIGCAPTHLFLNVLAKQVIAAGAPGTGKEKFAITKVTGQDYVTYGYFDSSTFTGLVRRHVTTGVVEYYGSDDGWHDIETASGHGSAAYLKDHADVDPSATDSPVSGDLLQNNGAKWINKTVSEVMASTIQSMTYTKATAGGTADALTATLSPAPANIAAITEVIIYVLPTATNTGAATLNVNSFGVKNIYKYVNGAQVDVEAGDIISSQLAELRYDGAAFVLLNPATSIGNKGIGRNENGFTKLQFPRTGWTVSGCSMTDNGGYMTMDYSSGAATAYIRLPGAGTSEYFWPNADKEVIIEFGLRIASQFTYHFGLIAPADIASLNATDGTVRRVSVIGETRIMYTSDTSGYSSDDSTNPTGANWYTYRLHFKPGSYARLYTDGVLTNETTSNLPSAGELVFGFRTYQDLFIRPGFIAIGV